MVVSAETILSATGIPYRRGRFIGAKPPAYIVYTDAITTDGADTAGAPARVYTHDVTVELYTDAPNAAAEAAVEAAITAAGPQWSKQDRYWLQPDQIYQVAYDFTFHEKVRV